MEVKIDYSQIAPVADVPRSEESWDAPRKVFFGKKNERGQMEKEPVYVHQEFPRMIYKWQEEKIIANIVHNQKEKDAALADGWEVSLAEMGVITAPSHEQILEMKAREAQKALESETTEPAPRVGRPRKVA